MRLMLCDVHPSCCGDASACALRHAVWPVLVIARPAATCPLERPPPSSAQALRPDGRFQVHVCGDVKSRQRKASVGCCYSAATLGPVQYGRARAWPTAHSCVARSRLCCHAAAPARAASHTPDHVNFTNKRMLVLAFGVPWTREWSGCESELTNVTHYVMLQHTATRELSSSALL